MSERSTVPLIVAAELSAGHDGLAEVLVGIRYPNGAQRSVSLPCDAFDDAALAAGVATLAELVGRPWTVLTQPVLTQPVLTQPAEREPSVGPAGRSHVKPNEAGAP
jgi:hypothetical protein